MTNIVLFDEISDVPVSNIPVKYQTCEKKLPGDFAMWIFIAMELTAFAIFFIAFAVTQRIQTEMFSDGKATLNASTGLLCTLTLIVSSYFVALAVNAVRKGNNRLASRQLIFALLSATIYLILKLIEYATLLELGYDLSTNSFYTLYFFITGFHFMHVLLGMIILTYMGIEARKDTYSSTQCSGFEAGASYWHMVDLVWLIVFFLINIIH